MNAFMTLQHKAAIEVEDENDLQAEMEEAAEDEARTMARPFREWLLDTLDWRGGPLLDLATQAMCGDGGDLLLTRERIVEDYTQYRVSQDAFRRECAERVAEREEA